MVFACERVAVGSGRPGLEADLSPALSLTRMSTCKVARWQHQGSGGARDLHGSQEIKGSDGRDWRQKSPGGRYK